MTWIKTDILKHNIMQAAGEALGTRKVHIARAIMNQTPWFCEEVKYLAEERRKHT
jgi:hypothetical protein